MKKLNELMEGIGEPVIDIDILGHVEALDRELRSIYSAVANARHRIMELKGQLTIEAEIRRAKNEKET